RRRTTLPLSRARRPPTQWAVVMVVRMRLRAKLHKHEGSQAGAVGQRYHCNCQPGLHRFARLARKRHAIRRGYRELHFVHMQSVIGTGGLSEMRFYALALAAAATVAACGGDKNKAADSTAAAPAAAPAADTSHAAAPATAAGTAAPITGTTHEVKMVGDDKGYRFEPATLT